MKKICKEILIVMASLTLSGCGLLIPGKGDQQQPTSEPVVSETQSQDPVDDAAPADDSVSQEKLTDDQALEAIRDYCISGNPDLEKMVNEGEYPTYWEVVSSDDKEIVVLYRSYTAALTRYYIDRESGETYVTEQVPGIIDEEQRTDETLNVYDLIANGGK